MNRKNSPCPVYGDVLWHLDFIWVTAIIGAKVAALRTVITLHPCRSFSTKDFWQLCHLGSTLARATGVTGSNSWKHPQ